MDTRRVSLIALVLTSLAVNACATTGATFRSGVADSLLEHPPYYAGAFGVAAGNSTSRIGHLPILYQKGGSQAPIFDPSLSPDMSALLERMNRFVDSLGVTVRLVDGGSVSAVTHGLTAVPPDVEFGCLTHPSLSDECADGEELELGRGVRAMRLAVGRPSQEWTAWIAEIMREQDVERVVVITVEVGQYLLRQRGLLGSKEVELGTRHVAKVPWLTSLETPVSVIQLTGAVVGPDGRSTRIGAEGLMARRTRLMLSAIGGQELITDEDVAELLVARRHDLPDSPLVWQVGLIHLVTQLTGG